MAARGARRGEVGETGADASPVPPPPGRDHAALCHSPVRTTARGPLSFPLLFPTTAQAKNPGNPPGDLAGASRHTPYSVNRGRPPLGRSDHYRVAEPCGRPGAHDLALSARDLSPRVSVAVGQPFLPDADDAQSAPAHPGGPDGRAARGSCHRGPTLLC